MLRRRHDEACGIGHVSSKFVRMTGVDPTAVGYGNFYGAGSLPGYAVAIDTFLNPGDTPVPALVLLDAKSSTALGRYAIPNIRDGLNHVLRVAVDAGKVNVWIDSVNYIANFVLPSATPLTGQWGFTGGTGGAAESHAVSDITMSFPNGQGCVP